MTRLRTGPRLLLTWSPWPPAPAPAAAPARLEAPPPRPASGPVACRCPGREESVGAESCMPPLPESSVCSRRSRKICALSANMPRNTNAGLPTLWMQSILNFSRSNAKSCSSCSSLDACCAARVFFESSAARASRLAGTRKFDLVNSLSVSSLDCSAWSFDAAWLVSLASFGGGTSSCVLLRNLSTISASDSKKGTMSGWHSIGGNSSSMFNDLPTLFPHKKMLSNSKMPSLNRL
mmetsp:Transcript_3967/g.8147  ORF Transcript_3967/g.8147 Transcript_3967/m.8147 type:complete len:235 (+) Transcript_3967:71-775(+)